MRKAFVVLAMSLLASPAPQAQRTATPDTVVPFKIQVSNADLADLKQRLSRARYADSFEDADWKRVVAARRWIAARGSPRGTSALWAAGRAKAGRDADKGAECTTAA